MPLAFRLSASDSCGIGTLVTMGWTTAMNAQMKRLELVDQWLDKVGQLPPGHPDRLRFLTYAEQILEGAAPAEARLQLEKLAPIHSPAGK
jgi:hypothetical protein